MWVVCFLSAQHHVSGLCADLSLSLFAWAGCGRGSVDTASNACAHELTREYSTVHAKYMPMPVATERSWEGLLFCFCLHLLVCCPILHRTTVTAISIKYFQRISDGNGGGSLSLMCILCIGGANHDKSHWSVHYGLSAATTSPHGRCCWKNLPMGPVL